MRRTDHRVSVASTHLLRLDASLGHKVVHDVLDRTLGDAHCIGYVAHADVGIAREADQHMPMIGQERPLPCTHGTRIRDSHFVLDGRDHPIRRGTLASRRASHP